MKTVALILLAILIDLPESFSHCCFGGGRRNRNKPTHEEQAFEYNPAEAVAKGIIIILGDGQNITPTEATKLKEANPYNSFAIQLENNVMGCNLKWVTSQLSNHLLEALRLCFPNQNENLTKENLEDLNIPSRKAAEAIKKQGKNGVITMTDLTNYILKT